jgi:hypothetical protein
MSGHQYMETSIIKDANAVTNRTVARIFQNVLILGDPDCRLAIVSSAIRKTRFPVLASGGL